MRSFASLYIYRLLQVYNLTINIRAMFVLIASHILKQKEIKHSHYLKEKNTFDKFGNNISTIIIVIVSECGIRLMSNFDFSKNCKSYFLVFSLIFFSNFQESLEATAIIMNLYQQNEVTDVCSTYVSELLIISQIIIQNKIIIIFLTNLLIVIKKII